MHNQMPWITYKCLIHTAGRGTIIGETTYRGQYSTVVSECFPYTKETNESMTGVGLVEHLRQDKTREKTRHKKMRCDDKTRQDSKR